MKKLLFCIVILNILLSVFFFIITKEIFYFSLKYSIEGIYWILVWYFLLLNIFVIIYSSKKRILKILFFQFTFLLIFVSYLIYEYEIMSLVENIQSVKNLYSFVQEIVFFIRNIFIEKKGFLILFIIEFIFLIILKLNFKDM